MVIVAQYIKIFSPKLVITLFSHQNISKLLKIIGDENKFIINNFIIGDQLFPHQKSENFGTIRKISGKIFSDKKNINNNEK